MCFDEPEPLVDTAGDFGEHVGGVEIAGAIGVDDLLRTDLPEKKGHPGKNGDIRN